MKRFLYILVAVVLLGAGAGIFLFRFVGQSGSGAVERWIGQELQGIANSYLNPHLSFTDLDYTYPSTVSLKNLRLTAEDPANPGTTIDIISCGQAVVTLAEIPREGKPVVIERIALDKPLFSAIAVGPSSKEFIGFSHLIRGGIAAATQPSPSAQPPQEPGQPPQPTQLSQSTQPPKPTPQPATQQASRPSLNDVFRIRMIELKDGKIVYDPRIAGTEPMMLDQINTSLKVEPADEGWYRLSLNLARDPIFTLGIAGQLNLDSFNARDVAMKLAAGIAEDKLDYLPPQLQKILKKYEVRGNLNILVIGDLPIMNPLKGSGKTEIKLTGANVTLGEYRIPVDDLALVAGFEDAELQLSKLNITSLKGTANLTGSMVMNEVLDTELHARINGMLLQELLAARKSGEPLKLAGKVNAALDASAPLKVVLAKTARPSTQPSRYTQFASASLPDQWGSGTMEMTEGRLLALPGVSKFEAAIRAAASIVNVRSADQPPSEQARLALDFTGERATVRELNYTGDLIAANGKGVVGLDRTLDLSVNAGPIQKVQSMLGKQVGGAIGVVTDKLLSYRVTGSVGNPEVKTVVAGGAVGNVAKQTGSVVESGAKAVGEGVNKIGEGIGNLLKPKD